MSKVKLINVDKAIQCAITYCEREKLSVEKLKTDTALSYCEDLFILRFPELAPEDRYDEIKGRGYPILIVNPDYSVTETEYTREYLCL